MNLERTLAGKVEKITWSVGIFDWTPDGGSGREFGWKFGTSPVWVNQKGFQLESMKFNRSRDPMEMWSGGLKQGVTWSNGQVQYW